MYFLEFFIRNKAWPDFMVVFSLFSLIVKFFGDIKIGKLGRFNNFGVNFEGKSAEVFIVDSSSSLDVFLDVLTKGLDDEMELGFRIEGFSSFVGTGLRLEMLARVIIGMFDNPE
jgi:hypothetical protein